MKKWLVLLTIFVFISGCATASQKSDSLDPTQQQSITSKGLGATIVGIIGATAGAFLDKKNRWRGAIIGGALGTITGVALADIAEKASRQAAQANKPITYTNNRTGQKVVATPTGRSLGRCKEIVVIIYEGDKEVSRKTDEKCI